MDTRLKHVVVDADVIAGDDPFAVIDPVWWTANIYDSFADFEASLKGFSRAQRWVLAICWYNSEVCNGGHDQFFYNSTGIVWRDALDGLTAAGELRLADILREAAERLGGAPSFDRDARINALEELEPDFGDLDARFYKQNNRLDASLMSYIRTRPEGFFFDGVVERPVGTFD